MVLLVDPLTGLEVKDPAILNRRHIEKWGQRFMRFGWIDFINDPAVSSALLRMVEAWAVQSGMTAVHGPLGFTDLDLVRPHFALGLEQDVPAGNGLEQGAPHGTVEPLVGVVGGRRQDGDLVAQALAVQDLPVQNGVLSETARAFGARHEEGMLAAAGLLTQGLEECAEGKSAGQALGSARE